ncbi:hypothetical protein N7457_000538 [Penicillium paradoxum]|uniref:uncharacterized protein n=1 Tax=Penicillium paradoxum TaxID=176176 RepID=UPI0025484553|nr:uncharacterized protein N7457_000538 [Penicillium paradoxum]KAJ5793939.1 hypothetical protein N7457_000538 [Penicillium paradoxum]
MSASDITIEPRCTELFSTIEDKFKASEIDSDKWYILVLSAISATPESHLCSQLYLYLINQPGYSSNDARRKLVRRMREVLFKDLALLGFPRPTEALLNITKVISEEDTECSFTREGWQCDSANHARGMEWLESIYAQNTEGLFDLFKTHPDFAFWLADITYGLHLSDRQVLDDVDTEMVVLPAVMAQDLPRMTYWHVRGTRRLGISKEDVKMVMDCVHLIVQACGVTLRQMPTVDAVEEDLVET